MIHRCLVAVVVFVTIWQYGYAQLGIQATLRSPLNFKSRSIELPLAIFITLTGHRSNRFNATPEVFLDVDRNKRVWPGLGVYNMLQSAVGAGIQTKYNFIRKSKLTLYGVCGFGHQHVSFQLRTNSQLIEKFVITTLPRNNWYGYIACGLSIRVSKRSWLTGDYGYGINELSFGYNYTFGSDAKN